MSFWCGWRTWVRPMSTSKTDPKPQPENRYGYREDLDVSLSYASIHPGNCAVRERTANGTSVGPCCFYLEGGTTCPRHGKVRDR